MKKGIISASRVSFLSTILSSAVVCSSILLTADAWGAEYEIDGTHSSAGFSVRHLMVSNVKGQLSNIKGTVTFDPANPTASKVEATIDASTVDTKNSKRDDHLRSADFLDSAKFPLLKFVSKKVEQKEKGKLTVTGDLTLHGVTKEVVLDVDGPTDEIKDPWGNLKRGVSATAKINRRDFGLTWNKALETGGVVVGDDVVVSIDLELQRKA